MYWQKRFGRENPDKVLEETILAIRSSNKDYGYRRVVGDPCVFSDSCHFFPALYLWASLWGQKEGTAVHWVDGLTGMWLGGSHAQETWEVKLISGNMTALAQSAVSHALSAIKRQR